MNVIYRDFSIEMLRLLVRKSARCQQYVKYECNDAPLRFEETFNCQSLLIVYHFCTVCLASLCSTRQFLIINWLESRVPMQKVVSAVAPTTNVLILAKNVIVIQICLVGRTTRDNSPVKMMLVLPK